jgi:predicted kinase
MSTPTLYLMLGLPGAGKTTAAKVIHELTGAVHLWADHERREIYGTPTYSHEENLALYDQLNGETSRLLGAGKSVVYDTNFGRYKDRQLLSDIADKNHATVRLVWIVAPEQLARERATNAPQRSQTRVLGDHNGNMPAVTFDHIRASFERPDEHEECVQLDGTKITPDYVKSQLGL